jgi:hypothetical protein
MRLIGTCAAASKAFAEPSSGGARTPSRRRPKLVDKRKRARHLASPVTYFLVRGAAKAPRTSF